MVNESRLSLLDNKNILKLMVVMRTKSCEYTKTTEVYTLSR